MSATIPYRLRGQRHELPLDSVERFSSDTKYTVAHGYCGHEVLLEVSLSTLLQRFPEQFTLLNRGHLVRTSDLERVEGESIHGCTVLVRGTAYPVARRRVRQIRQLLANKENRHA